MPNFDNLKKFDAIIKSLGSEPQILKERGEEFEDIPLGEGEDFTSDLSDLLTQGETPEESEAPGMEGIVSEGDEGFQLDTPDFDTDIRKDISSARESDTGADEGSLDNLGLEDFGEGLDLLDLGTEAPSDSTGDFSLPDNPVEKAAEEMPSMEAETGEEFALPEDFKLEEAGLPEEPGEMPSQAIGGVDETDFSLPDQFELGPVEGGETGAGNEEISEGKQEEVPEDFGLESGLSSDFNLPQEEEAGLYFEEGAGEKTGEPEPGTESLEFTAEHEGEEEIDNLDSFGDLGAGFESPGVSEETFELPDTADLGEPVGEAPSDTGEQLGFGDLEQESNEIPGQTAEEAPSDEEFAIDSLGELNLPEIGEKPEFIGEEKPEEKPARGRSEYEPQEMTFTEREFQAIQVTLDTLPRNLKLQVLDCIGKSVARGERLKRLINQLIRGASPSEIAALVSSITGTIITLPKQFEKKTGLEFETEKRSFKTVFKKNILPLLAVIVPTVIVLALFVFLGIKISVWIDAQNHYNRGLSYITREKNFGAGNLEFEKGFGLAPEMRWFYTYAEAFTGEKQYDDAGKKYEQLLKLSWKGNKVDYIGNFEKKGILDYASLKSKYLNSYDTAESLLNYLLAKDSKAKEALLALGDNYLDWADYERFKLEEIVRQEAPERQPDTTGTETRIGELYEAARESFAEYRNRFHDVAGVRSRFLSYFIKTDKEALVDELKNEIKQDKNAKVDPLVLAELGGYLVDKKKLLDVREILSRAARQETNVPEIHYHFARYSGLMNDVKGEETELNRAIAGFETAKPLSLKRILMLIASYDLLGKLYAKTNKIQDSLGEYDKAIAMIESPEQKKLFGTNRRFGEVYFDQGNVFYDAKDYDEASGLFNKARDERYENPDLDYKLGFIGFWNNDFEGSLIDFYHSGEKLTDNANVLFSIGNILFLKDNFYAAQGYYQRLIDLLEKKKDSIEVLKPKENPDHRITIELLVRAYNNIGVTLERLASRPRNPRKEAEALLQFTKSNEYFDILDRLIYTSDTMIRDKLTRSLAYINQQGLLTPTKGYNLYIYRNLPADPEVPFIDDLFGPRP